MIPGKQNAVLLILLQKEFQRRCVGYGIPHNGQFFKSLTGKKMNAAGNLADARNFSA